MRQSAIIISLAALILASEVRAQAQAIEEGSLGQ
jgi:hypothetical protein